MCDKKAIIGIVIYVHVKMVNIQVVLLTIQLYVTKLQKRKKEILTKIFPAKGIPTNFNKIGDL